MFKRVSSFFSKRFIGGFGMYPPGFAVYITLVIMTYYHGTSDGQIQQFQFGVRGKGEQIVPVNCIWLSSTFKGAQYHAVQVVGPKRKTNPNYVYEVVLPQTHVIADIRSPETLRSDISEEVIKLCLGWRRFFCRRVNWREALFSYIDRHSPIGDHEKKNKIFSVLKTAGVDALVEPNFTWQKAPNTCSYQLQVYRCSGGDAVALLNLDGVKIGKITQV